MSDLIKDERPVAPGGPAAQIPGAEEKAVLPEHLASASEELFVTHEGDTHARRSVSSPKLSTKISGVPLPALGAAAINWGHVDKYYRLLCPCMPFTWAVVLVATTGSFLFGLNTALLNTSADYIASDFKWCGSNGTVDCDKATYYKASVSTAVFLGAAAGAMTAGRFSNSGLRLCLLGVLIVFFVGVISSVTADGFVSLLWARLIVGYGVGLTSVITPAYISEMSPPAKRGSMGVMHQLVLVIGQLLAVFLGLAFEILPDDDAAKDAFKLRTFDRVWWRVMLGLGMIPVIMAASLFGPVFVFETPNYYARKQDYGTATELLRRLHNKEDVSEELKSLEKQSQEDQADVVKPPFGEALKRPGYMRALWVGIGISAFQQFTGINAFIASSNRLFSDAGMPASKVTWASIGLVAVNLCCTFIPLLVIERLGRRTLLIIGSIGMAVSVSPAAIMYYTQWNAEDNSKTLTALAIVGACLFVVFFAVAAGPITWVYLFEIFPMDIKARASSLCVAINWMASIVMVFGSGFLPSKVAYSVFMGFSVLYVIFVLLCVRETRGRAMGDSPYTNMETKLGNTLPV